jgi:hypothetical protein
VEVFPCKAQIESNVNIPVLSNQREAFELKAAYAKNLEMLKVNREASTFQLRALNVP